MRGEDQRTYLQLPANESLPGFTLWEGLKTVGVSTSRCLRDRKEPTEGRYSISSLPRGVDLFARAVCGHWSLESRCHRVLDVVYREDLPRIRNRALRKNMAWLNRFTLSLLKQHPARQPVHEAPQLWLGR